jgi:NADP-dependent 3-hydroxy acid dehydrogenase YdfG
MPMLSLTDRTILITGASSGIGAACAEVIAETGARLILLTQVASYSDSAKPTLRERVRAKRHAVHLDY